MASAGGVDAINIALNTKRKLASEGLESIEVDPGKKPKWKAGLVTGTGVAEEPEPEAPEQQEEEEEYVLPDQLDEAAVEALVDALPEGKQIDAFAVKGLVSRFEKAINTNVKMRSKFADQPEKFLDSEVALDESISAMGALAAYPELYGELVEANVAVLLLSMITHENTDIGIRVIALLSDLLDEDNLAGNEEETVSLFVDSLLKNKGLESLVNNLSRLDEKHDEDVQAVHNTFAIFENLIDVRPELGKVLALETKLLKFLCARVSKEGSDPNKFYAGEMLSILLQQGEDSVRKTVGETHLISILKVIAKYRRKDPEGPEETEFVENLFSALCFTLLDNPDNQLRFAKAEGLQLMIAILRKKKYAKHGALKSIDFALQRCQTSCEKFVDLQGLKALFALFLKRPKKKDADFESETEEHTVSIIVQLFMNLSETRYLRLLHKFQENDYQKVERLLELQEKYAKRLSEAEKRYRKQHADKSQKKQLDEDDPEAELLEGEDDEYERRIESGLHTLQGVCFLIGFVVTAGDKKLLERVVQLLHQSDSDIDRVRTVLEEYAAKVGDEEKHKKLKTVLSAIIEMLTPEDSTDAK